MTTENFIPVHFLVCVDGSPSSKSALRFACLKAKRRGGKVDMLYAVEPLDFHSLSSVEETMMEEQIQEGNKILEHLANEMEDNLGIRPHAILQEGKIGDVIIKQSAQITTDAGMLVLGVVQNSYKVGKLVTWVSSQIGSSIHLPVMLVPGNLSDEEMLALA